MKIPLTVLTLFLLQTAVPVTPIRAEVARIEDEEAVKAQIILNLPLVAGWPKGALEDGEHITLCTISDGKVASYLEAMAATPSYADHIRYLPHSTSGQWRECRVLFVGEQDKASMKAVLDTVEGFPVLTVGTPQGFARGKGMIGFLSTQKNIGLFSEKNVKFEINLRNTAAAGITLDPLLLELAEKIIGEGAP